MTSGLCSRGRVTPTRPASSVGAVMARNPSERIREIADRLLHHPVNYRYGWANTEEEAWAHARADLRFLLGVVRAAAEMAEVTVEYLGEYSHDCDRDGVSFRQCGKCLLQEDLVDAVAQFAGYVPRGVKWEIDSAMRVDRREEPLVPLSHHSQMPTDLLSLAVDNACMLRNWYEAPVAFDGEFTWVVHAERWPTEDEQRKERHLFLTGSGGPL